MKTAEVLFKAQQGLWQQRQELSLIEYFDTEAYDMHLLRKVCSYLEITDDVALREQLMDVASTYDMFLSGGPR